MRASTLAGEPITAEADARARQRRRRSGASRSAPHGWFAARPSGTEDVYKIYAESLRSAEHLAQIVDEAREIVARALAG